jgi:hypothetical protein
MLSTTCQQFSLGFVRNQNPTATQRLLYKCCTRILAPRSIQRLTPKRPVRHSLDSTYSKSIGSGPILHNSITRNRFSAEEGHIPGQLSSTKGIHGEF